MAMLRGTVLREWVRQPFATRYMSAQTKTSNSLTDDEKCDIIVVGGGIVGLATARQLVISRPSLKICLLEKEKSIATHQSGRNSGVIHAGIYYTPGTLKAKLCVEGLKRMYKYCDEKGIQYKKCGKLIVAVRPDELKRLDDLYERGLKNEVPNLRMVAKEQISDIEPHVVGLRAVYSPETGIVDYTKVSRSYGEDFKQDGGRIITDCEVTGFGESPHVDHPLRISVKHKGVVRHLHSGHVVTCAGLHADRLAARSGSNDEPRIVPFRGEYLTLRDPQLVRGNVYPVPDPKFPFLGVHFTPRMDGSVLIGPNAILALKREGYKYTDVSLRDAKEILTYSGVHKLIWRNIGFSIRELYKGLFVPAQLAILRQYIPSLKMADLDLRHGHSGVRAQAMDRDGNMVEDFVYSSGGQGALGERTLHVRNAPSPAATSSLAIAEMVATEALTRFGL